MIHHATLPFSWNEMQLETPQSLQGGSFLTKITMSDKPLYVYTPKCSTQGVITSGTKQYIEMIVPTGPFIGWIDALEDRVQALLYEKRDSWFVTDSIDLDDIQNAFIPTLKTKQNVCTLRVYLPQTKTIKEPTLQVYDEYESPISLSSIKDSIISILDITGVKFNQKCFQLVVNIRQIMVLSNSPFNGCMIKLKDNSTVPVEKGRKTEMDQTKRVNENKNTYEVDE